MGDDGIEWELEDLDGGVLYDVFYESTTMLAGRMLAQRRLAAARGDRDGERRAEADRRGLLAARGKVGPTDREALVRAKRAADSERGARAGAVAPWHAVDGSLKVDVEGIWRDDIRPRRRRRGKVGQAVHGVRRRPARRGQDARHAPGARLGPA